MSLPPYDQSIRDFERQFQVVLPDSVGQASVGFRDGVWYRLNSGAPHPVPIRSAIIMCPHAAGSIVQIVCWWMRENSRAPRALDLATELALTVGELARKAIEDDPLGMSLTTLPSAPSQSSSTALGASSLGAGYSTGSYSTGSYSTGSYGSGSYSTDQYPAAPSSQPTPTYEPAYTAATTLLPQITPNMPAPDMNAPGRSLGSMPRPALPPSGQGRPGPANPGYGGGRGQGGGMPGGRAPMAPSPGQTGGWDRPAGFEPGRTARPAGGPPPRRPGYDGVDPRDEYFRGGPPVPRRAERDEYGNIRPAQGRPASGRQDPDRSW